MWFSLASILFKKGQLALSKLTLTENQSDQGIFPLHSLLLLPTMLPKRHKQITLYRHRRQAYKVRRQIYPRPKKETKGILQIQQNYLGQQQRLVNRYVHSDVQLSDFVVVQRVQAPLQRH